MKITDYHEKGAKSWMAPSFFILLGLAVFAPCLRQGFIWDDEVLVVENSLIRSWSNIPAIFTSNFWGGSGSYYRPLPIFLFLVDFKIWGLHGFGFHLTNLLIHLIGMMFCFLLLRRHFAWRTAFFVTALYLIHPVSATVVGVVFGRTAMLEILLLGSLYFLCVASDIKRKNLAGEEAYPSKVLPVLFGVLSLASFAAALLSKESAAVFPFAATAYVFFCMESEARKKIVWVLAGFYVATGIYLALRFAYLPFRTGMFPLSRIADLPVYWRLWTFLKVLMEYLSLMSLPLVVVSERRYVVTSLSDPWPWISLILWTAAWIWAFRKRKSNPDLLFGLFWFFITLAPTSHLIKLPMTLAPHWLYVPSFGLYWLFASWIDKRLARLKGSIFVFLLGLVILLYGGRSVLRENDWRDSLTFFQKEVEAEPDSYLLRTNLGVDLFHQRRFKESKGEFLKALQLEPRYGTAINNLGAVFEKEGNWVMAENLYKKAIDAGNDRSCFLNLARLYARRGDRSATLVVLREAQKIYRYDDEIASLIGQVSGT